MLTPTPTVFIVDNDPSVRESLKTLVLAAGWRPEVFASAEEFLVRPRLNGSSCLLLDLNLPGLDGLSLQRRLAAERSDTPIVIIASQVDVPMTVRAMKAGAVALLMKPLDGEAVRCAVEEAFQRSGEVLQREAGVRELRARYDSLSSREQQVMALVVAGLLNKQAGGRLGITEITVKAHRGRVMRKMLADSLPDLVTMAASLRIAQVPMVTVRELRPARPFQELADRPWLLPATSIYAEAAGVG